MTSNEPYPHPVREAWAGNRTVLEDLFYAGRAVDRQKALAQVKAFDVAGQPPLVQQYKADLLAWMARRGLK